MIGAMIMCHGDDDGLRLPPRVAPKQSDHHACRSETGTWKAKCLPMPTPSPSASAVPVPRLFPSPSIVDKRDKRGGEKNWEWIKKGAPLRIEVGPRDLEANAMMVSRRDRPHKEKVKVSLENAADEVVALLDAIQKNLYDEARTYRDANIRTDITTFDALKQYFTPKNADKPEIHGGFVLREMVRRYGD